MGGLSGWGVSFSRYLLFSGFLADGRERREKFVPEKNKINNVHPCIARHPMCRDKQGVL